MRVLRSVVTVRAALGAALGLTAFACGGRMDGGGITNSSNCHDPTPLLVNGQDTGYDLCAGGQTRRRAVMACPNPTPGAPLRAGLCSGDQDCASGEICLCSPSGGYCASASCNALTCGAGSDCATVIEGCGGHRFACTTPEDACFSDSDCSNGKVCTVADASATSRVCDYGCFNGRPFLVDDEARLPSVAAREDWCASCNADLDLSPALRARLAREWTRAARMEHASIAAFARFTLQLVALGAPHDLVTEAGRAMADETEHARLAFGLASAYGGEAIGPGPLAVDGSLDGIDLLQLVETTFLEGCVGETIAAVEAREAFEHATDPRVREVLEAIARDETKHAELAWKTVAWAIRAGGDRVRARVEETLARVVAEPPSPPGAREPELLAHGVVSEAIRAELRQEVLAGIVGPGARAMTRGEVPPQDRSFDRDLHVAICAATSGTPVSEPLPAA